MNKESFIEIKSGDKFYINGKRFYVFYKERGDKGDVSLLRTNYFDINETDVGYEIVVKKLGGYVGVNIPTFSKVIVGNQFFNIDEFSEKFYCHNKVDFDSAYSFSDHNYTDIYYPIFHNIIDENKALSVSPSSDEEVIINSYRDYFQDYMRIQTYSHYQNDYVRFFLDISSNYHLNLKRVSLNNESVTLNKQSSVVEYQDVLYNNLNGTEVDRKSNLEVFKYIKKLTNFIKKSVNSKFVLKSDCSLWLNGYTKTPPNSFEGIVGLGDKLDFHRAKVDLLNEIRDVEWISVDDVIETSKKDSFIVINNSGFDIKIYFSDKWGGLDKKVNSRKGLYFLSPEAELERRVLEYQSTTSINNSKKFNKCLEQRIEKYAWKVKVEEDFSQSSIFSLIDGISDRNFDKYFKNYYKEFDLSVFKRIKNGVLGGVERAYLDVRVNSPFFVSVFEDSYSYYFVIVNSEYKEGSCRMIFGDHFNKCKWIGLKKNGSSSVKVDEYMEHREIYIDDIKFGGVLVASK